MVEYVESVGREEDGSVVEVEGFARRDKDKNAMNERNWDELDRETEELADPGTSQEVLLERARPETRRHPWPIQPIRQYDIHQSKHRV
jgi:hypothetical protein